MAVQEMGRQAHARLTEEFTATADVLARSTVQVRSGRTPSGGHPVPGAGSGVIWQPDGLVITNAHVARGSTAEVELWDGRTLEAQVVATDVQRDLAALTVEATELPAAPIGDSDRLRVGQLVVAMGNPLGLVGALTVGIVHAIAPVQRNQQTWVQADVHLAPGNSGGPLADVQGNVLGINAMVAGGLGLAVPSNDVRRFLQGREARPHLGVVLQPVLVPLDGSQVSGMLVLETHADSPAAAAGIILGDVLIGANGVIFGEPADLQTALYAVGAGGTVRLEILRGGKRVTRDAVVGLRAPETKAA